MESLVKLRVRVMLSLCLSQPTPIQLLCPLVALLSLWCTDGSSCSSDPCPKDSISLFDTLTVQYLKRKRITNKNKIPLRKGKNGKYIAINDA